jgi:hypothetical protein
LCHEERVSIAESGRRLDVDRKTVRRSLRQPTWQPSRRAAVAATLLTGHADVVRARAPPVNDSARILYQERRASRGSTGRDETVNRCVVSLREGQLQADRARLRFETPPGHQSQMAWGHALVPLRAGHQIVHVFVLTRGFSRRGCYDACADERLDARLQEAAAKDLSYADVLEHVLGEEVAATAEKNLTRRTRLARFPFVKSLEAFDVPSQPSPDKKQRQQVATGHVSEHGEQRVILGPPGAGKSHRAIGVGLKAIPQGSRVLCTTAAALIATLTRALAENRVEDKLKRAPMPRLLISDEMGALPIDRTGANLFC